MRQLFSVPTTYALVENKNYTILSGFLYIVYFIWATSEKNDLLHANNKDADQPVQICSLINAFDIR